jgi:CelD/BcsL family acetyltransferase involved in cellulose biosynthesis
MSLDTEVIESLEAAEGLAAEWDELAESLGRPYCSPAWLLPWYRHVAPPGAQTRIVVARDEQGLAAVAPFYAERRRGVWSYSLASTDIAYRVEPLVRPGAGDDAVRAMAAGLAGARPAPGLILLTGVLVEANWAERLRAAWPSGKAWVHRRPLVAAPILPIDFGDLDSWFKTKSSNFRRQMRRFRRRVDEAGAVHRVTESEDQIVADLAEFERLHRSRHEWRGGTDAFPPGASEMLAEVGRRLLPSGRFRLASIEIDGKAINSQLYLSAGKELTVWNTGFDGEYANLRVSYIGLVDGVEAAIEGGFDRFDLGPGTQRYKYRFAEGEDELETVAVVPPGARRVVGRLVYAPDQLRAAVAQRLTPEQKDRIRRLTPGGRRRAEAAAAAAREEDD